MQWTLCAMSSERMCIDQIVLHKVCYSKCGYHFIACVHLLCSFLVFSLVRLVMGATVLAVGVAVLDVGVTVLDVGVAVFQARDVTVLLAVSVAVLLAVGRLHVRPAPLTVTTLMVYLVPLCSPVKL